MGNFLILYYISMQEEMIPNVPVAPQIPLPPEKRHRARTLLKIALFIVVIMIILLLVLLLFLPRKSVSRNENPTLSYWGFWDENVMNPVIADFEKENPNIKINYTKQDPIDYRDKLSVRIPNGNGPDIFQFHNSWYPMLSDDLLPFPKETIEKKEFINKFYRVSQDDLIKNGAIYGIPLRIDTLALFINPGIFESASKELGIAIVKPSTWQEFIEASENLTKRDEEGKIQIGGAAIGIFDNVTSAPDIISLLFAQNGVDFSDFQNSEAKIVDALRFYTNLALNENNVWDETLDNSTLAFSQEKVAMYFGYTKDYFLIKEKNPDLKFEIIPVPQLLKEDKINIASYFAEGVSSKSQNFQEALLFMKFLTRPEIQKLFKLNIPYGDENLLESQAKTAVSSPFASGTFDNGLNDILNGYLKEAVNSILSGKGEEASVEALIEGYSQTMLDFTAKSVAEDN